MARLHDEVDAARAREALGNARDAPLRTWRCAATHTPTIAGRLFASASVLAFHAPPFMPVRLALADVAHVDHLNGLLVVVSRDERLQLTGIELLHEVVSEIEELRIRAVEVLMHRLALARAPSFSPTAQTPIMSLSSSSHSLLIAPPPLTPQTLAGAATARRLSHEVRAPLSACHVILSLPAKSMLRGAEVDGELHLTSTLLAFISATARASLTIPLSAVELPLATDGAGEALSFVVAGRCVCLCVGATHLVTLADELTRLTRVAQLSVPPRSKRLTRVPSPPPGVQAVRPHARDEAREAVKREAWRTYFAKHGAPDLAILRTQELPALVRAIGVPDELRPALWWHLSGAALMHSTHSIDYNLSVPCPKRPADEIERDLRRTLPDHPYFQRDEGISALRSVLTAYAARNPALGYCQSMNFVAALLLLFLSEERAFTVLALICERFLPGYYTPDMGGSLLDQRVFEELVAERLPNLHTHLTACGLPIPLLSLSWFLCLYSQILPLDGSLHLLDIFLTEGTSTVLFELGLAMLALNEHTLLTLPDPELLTDALRKTDLTALFARVLDPAHALPVAVLHERRARHRRVLVRHLRDENRARDRRRHKREGSRVPLPVAAPNTSIGEESPLGSPLTSPLPYSPGLVDILAAVRSSLAPGGSPPAHAPSVPLLMRDNSEQRLFVHTQAQAQHSQTQTLCITTSTSCDKIMANNGASPFAHLMLGGERLQALQRYVELGLLSVLREPKLLERDASATDQVTGVPPTIAMAPVPRIRSTSSPIRVPSSVCLDPSTELPDSPGVPRVQTDEIFSISL